MAEQMMAQVLMPERTAIWVVGAEAGWPVKAKEYGGVGEWFQQGPTGFFFKGAWHGMGV